MRSEQMSEPTKESLLELLEHEAFVEKILEIRKISTPEKTLWRYLSESPVIVALVTVIIGGIATQYIIGKVQENSKLNEQALQDHKQLLERQEEILQRAYGLAGSCISDAHRLISLTEPINEVESVSEPFQNAVKERRLSIWNMHYSQMDEWQIESNKIGLLIGHYFSQQGLQSWRRSQESIDNLLDCSITIYHKYKGDPRQTTEPGTNPCKTQFDDVKKKLDDLAASIQINSKE
jgi:hypothetical protein